MASRYHTALKQRKTHRSGGVVKPGNPGEVPPSGPVGEKTVAWPTAGPAGPKPFGKLGWPVVKTRAAKQGID